MQDFIRITGLTDFHNELYFYKMKFKWKYKANAKQNYSLCSKVVPRSVKLFLYFEQDSLSFETKQVTFTKKKITTCSDC